MADANNSPETVKVIALTVELGLYPKDSMIEVGGLGRFPNYKKVDLSPEQVSLFESQKKTKIVDFFKKSTYVKVSEETRKIKEGS